MNALRRALPLLALFASAPALGGSIYLNGTRVDGLTNTRIDKCAVEFDAKSDVKLDCPGYVVQVDSPKEARPEAPIEQITRHYFLVTEQGQTGLAEYDFDLFINSKFVRKLRNTDEQIVAEITKYLLPGRNVVTFVAKKKIAKERKSFSPEHFHRVVIGAGAAGGDKILIDDPLITFEKTAADTDDATQDFTLTAR